jgi:hypothetical protein
VGREDAADLLSICPGHLDKLVRLGRLPQPRLMDGRLGYVVRELEEAAVKLPHRGEEGYGDEALPRTGSLRP